MNRIFSALLIVAAGLAAGCGEEHHSTPGAEGPNGIFKQFNEHEVSSYKYIVDPPDEITILAPGVSELNEKKQTVSPTGTVTFNLIGEVQVAGKTPDEISAMLREMTKKFYTNPDIKIVVTAQSKFFYIFGLGANQQSKHPFTGRDSVIQALADAGFNESSWPEQVRVSRPAKDGKSKETAVVDFTNMVNTGDMSQNYLLEQNDVINVPQSQLAVFGYKAGLLFAPITGAGGAVGATGTIAHPGVGTP